MKKIDYLIVGQGLAGSLLAYYLLQRDKRIVVIDREMEFSSSKVAAGLYNPITGRKMVKTWNADQLFPLIEPFYQELQGWCEQHFIYPIGIYRPFLDLSEQNEWYAKANESQYSNYVKNVSLNSLSSQVNDQFGGLTLGVSGYVDIPVLLKSIKEILTEKGMLVSDYFDTNEIVETADHVEYRGIKASKIVFCTGVESCIFFDWLPFRPVKGEILDLSTNLDVTTIVNRGVFVIPKGEFVRVGSTYNHKDLSTKLTSKGEEYLITKFKGLLNTAFEIVGGRAGVRPATADRRPFIGFHPERPRMAIFNGFGTKGVSLVPYCLQQFYNHSEFGQSLDDEINISRYFSLI